jgi:hypothetical protein
MTAARSSVRSGLSRRRASQQAARVLDSGGAREQGRPRREEPGPAQLVLLGPFRDDLVEQAAHLRVPDGLDVEVDGIVHPHQLESRVGIDGDGLDSLAADRRLAGRLLREQRLQALGQFGVTIPEPSLQAADLHQDVLPPPREGEAGQVVY